MKRTGLILAAVFVGGFAILLAVIFFWGMGNYNRAKVLQNQITAKEQANTTIFDNMWKKIAQSTQVTDLQKDALKEVFVGYATARGGNGGGSFINAVHEAIPTVDVAIFKNLQNIITGARDEWTANQVALVDIGREYNTMLDVFPGNIVLRMLGFEKVTVKIVTSDRTDQAFKTGKDNDTKLK